MKEIFLESLQSTVKYQGGLSFNLSFYTGEDTRVL